MARKKAVLSPYSNSSGTRFSQKELLKQLSDIKFALDQSVILSVTDENGIIQYVNDKFCKITQYTPQELVGQPYRILNSGVHPSAFFAKMWRIIMQGNVWTGEVCNRAKDGRLFWLMTTIVPFLDEDGRPFQYITVRMDITDRKAAEQKILELNEELEDKIAQRTSHLEVLNKELADTIAYDARVKQQILDLLTPPNKQNSLTSPEKPLSHSEPSQYGLSDREIEVLRLIVSGRTNKEIADHLTITVHTVKSHVSNIIQKLAVADRTQAAIKAIRQGIVPPLLP